VPTPTLIAIGVGLVAAAVVLAYFTARAVGRPVAALRRTVHRLADSTLPS
jgi:HAMP domain-containing protein